MSKAEDRRPTAADSERDRAGAPDSLANLADILLEFSRLGVTSFGGPIAHFGYFRERFVARRGWLSEREFTDLVALCQFLPGPASSQTGFAVGVMRGGLAGGLVAWAGFTLPSVLLLLAFAQGAAFLTGIVATGILHGLKVVAVAVVAQAVWGMARSFCTDRLHATLAIAAVIVTIVPGGPAGQLLAIVLGAVVGLLAGADSTGRAESDAPPAPVRVSPQAGRVALALAALLLAAAFVPWASATASLFSAFYKAGALVFGGGHVILPLLEESMVESGRVSADAFLAGYGAAQAVPGPLFTFAAYLGAVDTLPPSGLAGAVIALAGIFLPGLLLVYGVLPFWSQLKERPTARAALSGINAAVVGILLSALYHPVWTSAVKDERDFTLVCVSILLLMVWRAPAWLVVLLTALGGAGIALLR
ncbi:chromate transporter [Pseudochelatococcus lubricantis]|uniref:Chromate transporter n=1 Tax=Pseudochelatococcus lubricantis TaxID=1538102 RepID=A0ABX0UXI1_9HYPH|nr:chromate efflux transporter [Pseudochelatococcus lubricantis]NIJ56589.1 chromate transporter [Pseudochelatococcus lubricantis]